MGVSQPRNIGAHIADVVALYPVSVTADVPQNTANKTPVIDRATYNYPQSMALLLEAGAVSGGPSAMNLTATVYTSDDGTTFSQYIPPPINGVKQTAAAAVSITSTAGNTSAELDVDLSGAGRYIAIDVNPNFTGGTSPAVLAAATASLGGAQVEPI